MICSLAADRRRSDAHFRGLQSELSTGCDSSALRSAAPAGNPGQAEVPV
jgi:hypothetical protein